MQIELNINQNIFLPVHRNNIEDYSNRYNIYWGGRGSGKTKYIIQKLLLKGLKEKRLILLMRKETNKLKDSLWKELKIILDEWQLTEYFELNRSDYRAVCKINGTEIKCQGLDEAEKIKGFADMSDVFLDELTAFKADDFDLIDGTLRSTKYNLPLQIYMSFNPVSKANWVYSFFGFDKEITPPDTYINHTTYLDNPYLDDSFLKRMENLKERNYNRWVIEALGDFVTLDKLIYTNWKEEQFDYRTINGKLLIGLDLGFNDPNALVASLLVEEEKRIYVFREWVDREKTNIEIASAIKSLGFGKSKIICDSAEPKSIEEIKREGIYKIQPSYKGKDSVLHGIQRLQNYELIVSPDCPNVIIDLENYSWKKNKDGEYINEPEHTYSHTMDALRYSMQCEDTNRLKSFDRSLLGI